MKVIFLDIDNTLLDFDEYTKRTLKKGFEIFGLGKFDNHVLNVFHHENDILWNRIEQGSLTFDELKKNVLILSSQSWVFNLMEYDLRPFTGMNSMNRLFLKKVLWIWSNTSKKVRARCQQPWSI